MRAGQPARLCLLVAMVATGCGGSGGGGGSTRRDQAPDTLPILVAATFLGVTATPAAGDTLQLLFSEDVNIIAGTLLNDADLSLSAGSLGAVAAAPTLKNPRTVLVPLASGVALQPGTTTITFGNTNDAIQDRTGNTVSPSTPVTIQTGDAEDPLLTVVTLSGVDASLNGTGSAGGSLQLPTSGFTIEASHSDASSPVDPARTIITASVAVSIDGSSRQAGLNLVDALSSTTSGATTTFTVPPNMALPVGSFEMTVYVVDSTGRISGSQTAVAQTRQADDSVRPFETTVNASQVWFIDTSRDVESYSVNVWNYVTPIAVDDGANGRADLDDLLLALGLFSNAPLAKVSDAKSSNDVVMDRLEAAILAQLNGLFAGANITFTFTSPAAWVGGSSVVYNDLGFSRIALSGAESASGTSGTLGIAIFDPSNKNQDDNTRLSFGGDQRLGVFLHTIVNDGIVSHPTTTFRVTFDPFTPGHFGIAIGDDGSDGSRLLGSLTDGRATYIDHAISRIARFAAVILAHECGHSMGLVMNGAMPRGLYGNDATNFPVFPSSAADGHIKMPASLFPGVSENVMSPSFDFDAALATETRFNTLNRAYLRETVIANGN